MQTLEHLKTTAVSTLREIVRTGVNIRAQIGLGGGGVILFSVDIGLGRKALYVQLHQKWPSSVHNRDGTRNGAV